MPRSKNFIFTVAIRHLSTAIYFFLTDRESICREDWAKASTLIFDVLDWEKEAKGYEKKYPKLVDFIDKGPDDWTKKEATKVKQICDKILHR